MRWVAAVVAVVLASAAETARAADEASVTHLVPSGAQQGKTVEVVLQGDRKSVV